MYGSRLALILSLFAVSLAAHEQPTHQNLTVAALNYTKANDPGRFALLQQYGSIYSTLAAGAWNEDNDNRFVFHFLPNLNDLGEFATCSSADWGIAGLSCTSTLPFTNIGRVDDHTWPDALSAVDSTTGAPTLLGWAHLGYVVHLLEDLTSPPHTRNSAHPCKNGAFGFCDPFEWENQLATVSFPNSDYIGLSNLSGPQDLFQRVRNYTHDHYFSARTVFNGDGGPIPTYEDPDFALPAAYFYGDCLQASRDFGTCGPHGRKIAYKGGSYYSLQNEGVIDRSFAEIDTVIAQEQFRELGPATVTAVVALIRLYAPMLTVQLQGDNGTGSVTSSPTTGINCGTTCTALFVTGTTVTLTAADSSTELFSGWSQDCSGATKTVTVTLTADMTCVANFSLRLPVVRLNPFGNQSVAPPYSIDVVNSQLTVIPAPGDITVTLLREVISQCSGLLFLSNRTVVVSQGQSSASYNFNAGRDPACNKRRPVPDSRSCQPSMAAFSLADSGFHGSCLQGLMQGIVNVGREFSPETAGCASISLTCNRRQPCGRCTQK